MTTAPVRPADLARWAFWVPFRGVLDPNHPETLHALNHGWKLQWQAAGSDRSLMADEYRRWLGDTLTEQGYRTLVRDTYRKGWRVHLEELLLSKLSADTIDDWVRLEGVEHLHEALSRGKGVIWVYPHAGPVMLMLAALAHRGFPYIQYAARGMAPENVAEAHPELLASNRWRDAVRQARESHENSLPIEFLTLDAPVRTLHRRLADNHIVGLALDGRIGSGWFPAPFLNRTALLSRGPWKLATTTEATVLPVFCHTPDGAPSTVQIGAPIEPNGDWRALASTVIKKHEAWLSRHPEEYGLWLLHTRQRCAIDDHPLFVDTALDDRHRRWLD